MVDENCNNWRRPPMDYTRMKEILKVSFGIKTIKVSECDALCLGKAFGCWPATCADGPGHLLQGDFGG